MFKIWYVCQRPTIPFTQKSIGWFLTLFFTFGKTFHHRGIRAIPNMTIAPETLLIAALFHTYSVLVIANSWAPLALSDKEQFTSIELNRTKLLTWHQLSLIKQMSHIRAKLNSIVCLQSWFLLIDFKLKNNDFCDFIKNIWTTFQRALIEGVILKCWHRVNVN